jgi:hypothetical protein
MNTEAALLEERTFGCLLPQAFRRRTELEQERPPLGMSSCRSDQTRASRSDEPSVIVRPRPTGDSASSGSDCSPERLGHHAKQLIWPHQ